MSLQIKAMTVEKIQTWLLHDSNSYLQQWREDSPWVDEVYTQELRTVIKTL